MTEVDRIPDGTDGAGTKAPATLCSLPGTTGPVREATQHLTHRTVTAAVPVSHGHRSCHRRTARGAGAAEEPVPLLSPSSSQARSQALEHKTETSCKFLPQSQRLLCCPCRVGWR